MKKETLNFLGIVEETIDEVHSILDDALAKTSNTPDERFLEDFKVYNKVGKKTLDNFSFKTCKNNSR